MRQHEPGSRSAAPAEPAGEAPLQHLIAHAAAALARGDAAAARTVSREAVALARSSQAAQHLLGEACMYEAIASSILFDYVTGYERALEAEALLKTGSSALRARAVNACFVICAETGNLNRALDYARRAVDIARGNGDAEAVARVLNNCGNLFRQLEEYEEAKLCLGECVALYETLPHCEGRLFLARVNLAHACQDHALRLSDEGQDARAAQLRWVDVAQALPPLPGPVAVPLQASELTALGPWVVIQAELGHLAEARSGALRLLKSMRQAGGATRYKTRALTALAAVHFHHGRIDRGIRLQGAAITRLLNAGMPFELLEAQERLVRMHAARGQHAQALACMRAAHADRSQLQIEQTRLRCRLSALEREAVQRRTARLETLVHTQRLAVVGRLMADIYHALDAPITRAHQALARCVEPVPPQTLTVALSQVIEQIDAVTALARQLKMFSYRAAPQAMVVGLHESLQEAWTGVALWRRGSARRLSVSGDLGTQVKVDVQRLAVLLRILLIEIDKAEPTEALAARIARGERCGRMELGGPVADAQAAATDPSVGVTLCQEIVQEMGGSLTRSEAASGFVLQLPAP